MTPPVVWTFAAVPRVRVQCPNALIAGVARIIGQRYDDASGEYVVSEPTTYRMSRRDAALYRGHFAKHLRHGELVPGDAATAEAFGVPYAAPVQETDR